MGWWGRSGSRKEGADAWFGTKMGRLPTRQLVGDTHTHTHTRTQQTSNHVNKYTNMQTNRASQKGNAEMTQTVVLLFAAVVVCMLLDFVMRMSLCLARLFYVC